MQRAHAMPFGAETAKDGTRFALWAPTADDVVLVLDGTDHEIPAGDEAGGRSPFRASAAAPATDTASTAISSCRTRRRASSPTTSRV